MRYGIIITSNGYQDRDGEYVTTKALDAHVSRSYDGDDYIGDEDLLFYHDKSCKIGKIIGCGMVDGFLVELVEEIDTPTAKRVWDLWQKAPQWKWGASQGFYGKRRGDTFEDILKDETSLLLNGDASNVYTVAMVI